MTTNVYVIFGAAVRENGSPSGTLERRTTGAWQFAASQPGVHIFVLSGAVGKYPPSEAQVMQNILMQLGAMPDQLIKDEKSTDTLDTIINTQNLMHTLPAIDNVFVCTSPYHSWRCRLLFQLRGIPAKRARMPGDLKFLGLRKWLFYCFKECVATPWDALLISLRR
ncbi:YdcF family protein [Aestuariibacter salexigens]|uniref:YdcF family protein n=1 Tax=Aestuariibacter salexigens TaxID=226010 RepID=UPI0003FF7E31|nr:YdcF family protein [Aestuariibacter salexigens]